MKPVTAVIPVVKRHDRYLPDIFADLADDSEVLERIVIARSGLPNNHAAAYEHHLRLQAERAGLKSRILLTSISRPAREAPNRNRGWARSETELTAFLDADDRYASGRLAYLCRVAQTLDASLVLHDYIVGDHESMDLSHLDSSELALSSIAPVLQDELRSATFGDVDASTRLRHGNLHGNTNLILPDRLSSHKIHHAHVVVKTSLRERISYRDIYPGSDGLFCQEVLVTKETVAFIPKQLSAYRPQMSAYASDKWLRRTWNRVWS